MLQRSPFIYHDERRIMQILLNLQSNAIKYTETGHVKIIVTVEEGFLVLFVEDTGIGIS
jgi:signal transduction histidine kinase